MKNLKLTLSALIVLALLSGLFVKSRIGQKEYTQQEFLFDTLCTITTYSKSDSEAVNMAFNQATQLHRLADFFDTASDVSKINNAKSNTPISVDSNIINMLALSQEICQKSKGAFDITIAPLSRLWQFDSEGSVPPDKDQINYALTLVNGDGLIVDTKAMTVTKKSDGISIDLGGIAKGYAADKSAEILKNSGVRSALIDFGGNIVTLGENPKTDSKKWRIGLQTPYAPTGEYSKIIDTCGENAVVTSGTYQRYFEHNGVKYHHIIDPKTGYPAKQSFDSVTVVAPNAALADCLATAIFVIGENMGKRLAAEYGAEVYFLP